MVRGVLGLGVKARSRAAKRAKEMKRVKEMVTECATCLLIVYTSSISTFLIGSIETEPRFTNTEFRRFVCALFFERAPVL